MRVEALWSGSRALYIAGVVNELEDDDVPHAIIWERTEPGLRGQVDHRALPAPLCPGRDVGDLTR